ncbi:MULTISPECIES: sugar nucleotide-binding protein [Bacillota]|jgi:dTDP-4-dehydrorhamnose reductase|uniref:dTDP-4-dehydrorhamnose reductase n=2 Tax=Amedibacillus TaxID=2749846 RepID=A0A7G9GKP3_9FIRM|nr:MULTISPECIES: sugar nucleotide-binding protein [Bacillota]QNM11375.1 sugar nucleotide-binding protein [[Eubacterium] hominis]MCH4284616.1 sugar nucleotide-binding protein [Amedibacillus hominis]RGB54779.1 NAD-dependent epimerase/dehydratase family protein [Absiella sp. AM22-9]RGB60350.1 NAD-dependent epimerase/dehydratase family protein [Absiella sp. AM10-20]RGB65206.1 NAD-dependent epimerase/dehydratase family protein [Absiella sp. AM09-45]
MNFLVLGSSGMAGHTIALYLQEKGHKVTGFSRKKIDFIDTIIGDAKDLELLRGIILAGKYDAIINCIGILNQNAEKNKTDAIFLNGYLPHYLVSITEALETKIIQMSTDCVFSGKNGNYTENSIKDGDTFYDRTKAIGEIIDKKNITLRNSIIGPDINPNGIGLFNWFMSQKKVVKGYTKVMWTGLTTLQLAKIIERMTMKNISGLYNMVPSYNISKYDLLKLFNYYMKEDLLEIVPFDKISIDKTLIRTNYEFKDEVPTYEEMIFEMSEWIKKHKILYPHYDFNE